MMGKSKQGLKWLGLKMHVVRASCPVGGTSNPFSTTEGNTLKHKSVTETLYYG